MLSLAKESLTRMGETLKQQALFMAGIVAILWAVEIVDMILPFDFDSLGIRPRSIGGLIGIPLAPLLHGDFWHLFWNSLMLFFLGWVVLWGGRTLFFRVSGVAVLTSGLGTWLMGSDESIHIGSSGVIYGYLSFLLLRGFFEKSLRWVIVALIVGFTLYGMLDFTGGGDREISWSGHISGFAGGALAAWLFFYRPRIAKLPPPGAS
jgi:membrane associated rhomboid family serine protease